VISVVRPWWKLVTVRRAAASVVTRRSGDGCSEADVSPVLPEAAAKDRMVRVTVAAGG